jgi:hypothetical protein
MTVVAMSSLFFLSVIFFYCLQHILWSTGVLVGSLVGRMTGSLLDGGVFDSLALITDEPLVGIDVRSLMV